MTKFSNMARQRRMRLVGLFVVIPVSAIVGGLLVANSLAAPEQPVPVISAHPLAQATLTSATFRFSYPAAPASWQCSLDAASFTPCGSGISYAGLAEGSHTFRVEALSGHQRSGITTYRWLVVPPAPVIFSAPAAHSTDINPEFQFFDAEPWVTFTCQLDSGPHLNCTGDTDHDGDWFVGGEWRFHHLTPGPHCFAVYATDWFRLSGPPARYCWALTGTSTSTFTVGGDLTTPLYPGTSGPLDLTFTNPGSAPITIPAGNIAARNIAITSSVAGCTSSNFAVTQGLTASVTIPAGQTTPISLSALGVPQSQWPVIEMVETNTNQDACEGARLTLTYSGIEATG